MPEPRGFGFVLRAKVDADHASDTMTRHSRMGFLAYINSALVHWHSKKQNSVESSSFGSEFIAMKQCCEYLRGLRYKLRMMGIPVEEPTFIHGDNQSELANTNQFCAFSLSTTILFLSLCLLKSHQNKYLDSFSF